jgi:dCMP deaminase
MKQKHAEMYMEMAEVAAKNSTARRLKVGSIAVREGRILSVGYNGTPPGMDNNCENEIVEVPDGFMHIPENEVRYLKTKPEVIHAEMNLIYKLARDGESGNGADVFITHSPCFECAKALLSVGFRKIYYRNEYRSSEGLELIKSQGIEIEQI